jgi:allantoin racemase
MRTARRIAILNPNATVSMTEDMAATARATLGPDVAVRAMTNLEGPPAIQGEEDARACLPGLFALAEAAQAEGADAIVIGCFDDTGLAEMRAQSPIPVVGLGEAGCVAAALAAPRFAVVTSLPVATPIIERNIRTMGLWPRCAGVRASGAPVLALREEAEKVRAAIASLVDADPRAAVVLGCGGMSVLAETLRPTRPCVLVDPVRAAAALAAGTVGSVV